MARREKLKVLTPVRTGERPECRAGHRKHNKAEVPGLRGTSTNPNRNPERPRGSGSVSLRGAPVTPGGCRDTLGAPRGLPQRRRLLLINSPNELLWSSLLLEAPVTVTQVSDTRMQNALPTQVPPCQFTGSAPKIGGNGAF